MTASATTISVWSRALLVSWRWKYRQCRSVQSIIGAMAISLSSDLIGIPSFTLQQPFGPIPAIRQARIGIAAYMAKTGPERESRIAQGRSGAARGRRKPE
jgi:hypothetical protein